MLQQFYCLFSISKPFNKYTPVNVPAQCRHFRQANIRSNQEVWQYGLEQFYNVCLWGRPTKLYVLQCALRQCNNRPSLFQIRFHVQPTGCGRLGRRLFPCFSDSSCSPTFHGTVENVGFGTTVYN